jgi:hypothetical protein
MSSSSARVVAQFEIVTPLMWGVCVMDASQLRRPALDESTRTAVVAALDALDAKLASEGPVTCVGPLFAMGIGFVVMIGGLVLSLTQRGVPPLVFFGSILPISLWSVLGLVLLVLGAALIMWYRFCPLYASSATGFAALVVVSEFARTTSLPRGWRFEAVAEDAVEVGARGHRIHYKRFFLQLLNDSSVLLNDSGEQRSTSGLCVRPDGPTPTLNALHGVMVSAR